MAKTFQWRADKNTLNAWYGAGGLSGSAWSGTYADWAIPANMPQMISSSGMSSVFGSSFVMDLNTASTINKRVYWPGGKNITANLAFTTVIRFVPNWTGNPSSAVSLIEWGMDTTGNYGLQVIISAAGVFQVFLLAPNGSAAGINGTASGFTANTATELAVWWDGSTTAGHVKVAQDGVSIGTGQFTTNAFSRNQNFPQSIMVGTFSGGSLTNKFYPVELLMFDDTATFGTYSSGSYTARTTFWDNANATFDGSSYTDPGVANVRSTTSYTFAGVSETGTSVMPTTAQVQTGVSFDTASTGTYDGSDRWTDPGQTNVRNSTAYKANSTTNNKTGSLVVPAASNVLSGVTFDNGTVGTAVTPSADDVRSGVATGGGTGNLVVPVQAVVLSGIVYDSTTGGKTKTGTLTFPPAQVLIL